MSIAEVGARLVLTGKSQFLADMAEATAATDKFNKSMAKSATAAESSSTKIAAANDKVAASQKKVTDATAATTDANATHAAVAADVAAASGAQRKAADDAAASTKRATDAVRAHNSALTTLASNTAVKKTALFGSAVLLGGAYESIKKYNDLNKAITQSVVDAGVSKKNIGKDTNSILNISKETGVNAKDVADQFYRIASAANGLGKTNKQIVSLTQNAAKLAVLGNVPKGSQTEQVGRIFGAMLSANLRGAGTPKQIDALINSAVGHGDIRVGDMIGAIGKLLPAAKSVNASAPDTLGWIDLLTKQGMQGSTAGTLVNHSLQQLAHPTEQGAHAEMMLGLAPGDLANIIKTQGVPAAFQALKTATQHFNPLPYYPTNTIGGSRNAPGLQSAAAQLQAWGLLNPEQQAAFMSGVPLSKKTQDNLTDSFAAKIFGNAKSATPALAILNDPQKFAQLVSSIEGGATTKAFDKSLHRAMNSPGRQRDIAIANLQTGAYAVGKDLTPLANNFLNTLGHIANWFTQHTGVLKATIAGIAAIVGASVIVTGAEKLKHIASGLRDIGSFINNLPTKIFKSGTGVAGATGASGLTEAATALNGSADALDLAATRLQEAAGAGGLVGKGKGGLPGAAGKGAGEDATKTLETDAEKGAPLAPLTLSRLGLMATPAAAALGGIAALSFFGAKGAQHAGSQSVLDWELGRNPAVNGTPFVTPSQAHSALNAAAPRNHINPFTGRPYAKYQEASTAPGQNIPGQNKATTRYNDQSSAMLNKAVVKFGANVTHFGQLFHATPVTHGHPAHHAAPHPTVNVPNETVMKRVGGSTLAAFSSAAKGLNTAAKAQQTAGSAVRQANSQSLSAAQKFIASASDQKAAVSVQKQSANEAKRAASDGKAASALQKTAATQTGQAAKDSAAQAKVLQGAAKAHSEAAAALKSAGSALEGAAKTLAGTKIQANVTVNEVGNGAAKDNANKTARS